MALSERSLRDLRKIADLDAKTEAAQAAKAVADRRATALQDALAERAGRIEDMREAVDLLQRGTYIAFPSFVRPEYEVHAPVLRAIGLRLNHLLNRHVEGAQNTSHTGEDSGAVLDREAKVVLGA